MYHVARPPSLNKVCVCLLKYVFEYDAMVLNKLRNSIHMPIIHTADMRKATIACWVL